jgi:hypothetical protein
LNQAIDLSLGAFAYNADNGLAIKSEPSFLALYLRFIISY